VGSDRKTGPGWPVDAHVVEPGDTLCHSGALRERPLGANGPVTSRAL